MEEQQLKHARRADKGKQPAVPSKQPAAQAKKPTKLTLTAPKPPPRKSGNALS